MSLRPHAREVFEEIVAEGHHLYLWSGVGIRWEVVDRQPAAGGILAPTGEPLHPPL